VIYRFGEYSLDTDTFEMSEGGEPKAVEPQVFDLLLHLIRNRERVVTKNELFDALWPERVVSEATLSSRLMAARKAVGDTGTGQEKIRTVRGRGFRWIAPVEQIESGPVSPSGRASAAVPAPSKTPEIHYTTTEDGVPIAYSCIGSGPLLVRVLGWFTHLQMEWDWPELRAFWETLAEELTVVRYDGRGIGLSARWSDVEFNEETRQLDLRAVVDALGAHKVNLLGISEGGWTAAQYALDHPSRAEHLIFYGAYARGALARPSYDPEEEAAMTTLMRKGWGRDTPRFRQLFTSTFFPPDADPEAIAHFNELQRISADPEIAARYHAACNERGDGRAMFGRLRQPSLIIHQRNDRAVSFLEGQVLAATIPGAGFLPLEGSGHYFPIEPSITEAVSEAIVRFVRAR
jgi:pimeloyl-ACP methyl ester carboxylesterase/DNA-binding winged helix-turn-helix (wHTH) protein